MNDVPSDTPQPTPAPAASGANRWMAVSAVASSLSACVAVYALLQTMKLAENSDATFAANTRAYIAVTGARFDEPPTANANHYLRVEFKNVGKTSAEDLVHVAAMAPRVFEFKPDGKGLPWINEATTNWVRMGGCGYANNAVLGRPVYPDVANYQLVPVFNHGPDFLPQSLIDGESSFFIIGCFVYRTLGKERTSTYCFYLQPRRGRKIDAATFEWCPTGSTNPT